MRFTCSIVSAERSLVNETVDEVEIPGADGYFGVLPGHTPLLRAARRGRALGTARDRRRTTSRSRIGFAEVQPDRVTILAQTAEKAEEIDVAQPRRESGREKRAEERLRRGRRSTMDARARAHRADEGADPPAGLESR